MINSTTLTEITREYQNECTTKHQAPTYKGLAKLLNISGHTISNVMRGTYNGIKYKDKAGHKRCIDTKDFETIRGVFRV